MKFQRNAKLLRGHLDAAPFAGVFFLLIMFLLLTDLIYTPGVHINLPVANADLPGVSGPTVSVGLDKEGHLYFENQSVGSNELRQHLIAESKKFNPPPTLVVMADRESTREMVLRLALMAAEAGITNAQEQTLPRPFDTRTAAKKSP